MTMWVVLFIFKALRETSLVSSLISMEMASFLTLTKISLQQFQFSAPVSTMVVLFVVAILILEGVVGLAIMASTAFPKTEKGVNIMSTCKW
uniref:NADH dehydrogenase subunit 4L n=1 Tax=Bovicola ovis TaxID=186214 RepID=A0A386B278_9NEOP|nr:NADH dehydrogenase subunit 4L [Bovicola ovis]